MMKRFGESQIVGICGTPRQVALKDLYRKHGSSEASYYLCRSKCGGMSLPQHSVRGGVAEATAAARACRESS